MARPKLSKIAQLISLCDSIRAGLIELHVMFDELQTDSEALKELRPLISKVKNIYFPDETPSPPANEPSSPPDNKPKRTRKPKSEESTTNDEIATGTPATETPPEPESDSPSQWSTI